MSLKIETKKQGAELTSICYQGEEKLFQGEKVLDEKGKLFWKRQAPILFPIVGQLKEGRTQIEGQSYEMPQHGFARDMQFTEVCKTEKKHQYKLKSNAETLKKFPYHFELEITYIVSQQELEVKYEVKNQDEKEMLFGLGGHPAFCCDYTTENYEILFEKQENKIEFLTLENGLISNQKVENQLQQNKLILRPDTFEKDAIIMKNLQSNKVVLQNGKTKEKVLEFGFQGFPYLAFWSKKGAPFVCIEPWQNTADKEDSNGEFQTKENILKLQPKETFSCCYQIKFF